nr:uncharacterized protein LOC128702257 [Cherax quadricarinatus]
MECSRSIIITWVLLAALLLQGLRGIKITRVSVPAMLEVGGNGDLDCSWEEDTDHMYSIKWYQGAHEFYRYTPTFRNPIQVFPLPTLDVDLEKSWGGSVRITNVSLAAEGPFHCEVSADGPTFHTASDSASLTVVDLPDEEPAIKGVRSYYPPGSWVDITCISLRSKPPPILAFTINKQPVSLYSSRYNTEGPRLYNRIPGRLEPQFDQTDDRAEPLRKLRLGVPPASAPPGGRRTAALGRGTHPWYSSSCCCFLSWHLSHSSETPCQSPLGDIAYTSQQQGAPAEQQQQ